LKFGISKRKHMPALFSNGSSYAYPLWKYGFVKKIDETGLVLGSLGANILFKELPTGVYDPPFSLKGQTVLDIGATNGEVAWWYLNKFGAKKIICIECDEEKLQYLRQNKAVLKNIEIIPEQLNMKHLLREDYDFIKCDIEGYEMILIDYMNQGYKLKPCVLEVHTNWIKDRFVEKGFSVRKTTNSNIAQIAVFIMCNF
jgi:16S rRNA G966 N2-methylase RsmD